MDWPLAIEKNRTRLLAIIVALLQTLGLSGGGRLTTLPHYLHRRALAILRPAESALRSLIVMAAHALTLKGFTPRKRHTLPANAFTFLPAQSSDYVPAFQFIEPLKTFGTSAPDFTSFGTSNGDPFIDNSNRTPIPAAALGLRLLALKRALDTLPIQAKRLARWYAARDRALQRSMPHRLSPKRPGLPPAWRTHNREPIHELLHDCHSLALYALNGRGVP